MESRLAQDLPELLGALRWEHRLNDSTRLAELADAPGDAQAAFQALDERLPRWLFEVEAAVDRKDFGALKTLYAPQRLEGSLSFLGERGKKLPTLSWAVRSAQPTVLERHIKGNKLYALVELRQVLTERRPAGDSYEFSDLCLFSTPRGESPVWLETDQLRVEVERPLSKAELRARLETDGAADKAA
jgi:hypothetical protein